MTVEELREVDRKVIARANNELFGSFSYFLTTADGGVFGAKGVEGAPDEHHLSKAIGELKMQANRDYHRAEAQAQEIQRLREALERVLPPARGLHGGPFVGAKFIYEDGTDEDTARHRGWLSHEAVSKARAALSSIPVVSKGDTL